jgi:hypothetical protein
VDRSIDADRVVAILDRIALTQGFPKFVRFDNGPEFIARAVADRCRFNTIGSCFIDPGSPWQNAWIESFNGRFRDELCNGWQFDSVLEAQVLPGDLAQLVQHPSTPLSPRAPHPERVRPRVDHHQPTPTRIAPGPHTGTPPRAG